MTILIILVIGGSGSGKTNVLLNLIKNQQPDIDKIYLQVEDPFESKYQLLISGREKKVGIKTLEYSKAFIEYLQKIDYVYENFEDYNPTNRRRMLIVFHDMMADMQFNRKSNPIVTKLFLRGRKLNISLAFMSQVLISKYLKR